MATSGGHARSGSGPRPGFTRVVRNQLASGGGTTAAGRRTFAASPYGGDADSMEAGGIGNGLGMGTGTGWGGARKLA
jgi:hypothetical protein